MIRTQNSLENNGSTPLPPHPQITKIVLQKGGKSDSRLICVTDLCLRTYVTNLKYTVQISLLSVAAAYCIIITLRVSK